MGVAKNANAVRSAFPLKGICIWGYIMFFGTIMGSFIYLYTTNKHTKKSKVKPMRTVRPRPVQKSGNAQIDSGTAAFIKKQLLDFEVKAGVRVIYAVECGARG